jgi:two-component SAPR family response regulator
MHSLWYQVDEGDSDPASFFYYLGLAAQRANPRKKKPLPFLTPEYLLGIKTFSQRFFESVYSRLLPVADNNALPFAIVFDNCQEVKEGAPFHEILNAGVSQVPGGVRVIFISREDPPESFVRLRANSLMETIGWDDLKFTLDESNGMVRLRHNEAVSIGVLEQVYKKTDGWAAGIVLLLEGARKSGIESALAKVRTPKEIFQYFAREILDRANPGTRDFLLKTSLFQQMSVKMAQALTGNRQAQRILSDLNGKNYFTQRLESETAIYRYHPLFREFLEHLAIEVIDPRKLINLEKKAAAILEANGQPEDAVELLKRAGDWPGAVLLILKHAPSLVLQGRSRTLEGWIEGLPEAVLQAEPWLVYWAGVCLLPYSPLESHVFFERVFKLFRARSDAVGTFLSLSGMFESTFYANASFKPLDKALALLDDILREFPDFPSFEIQARITADKLRALVLRQPWHPDLEKTVEQALIILHEISDENIRIQILQALVLRYLFMGQTSGPLLGIFLELARTPGIPPLLGVLLKAYESVYFMFNAEFENMKKAAEEGLELATRTGVHVLDPILFGYGAAAALSVSSLEAADPFLEKMAVSLHPTDFWSKEFYHDLCGWKSLLQQDVLNSLHHYQMSLKFGLQAGAQQTPVCGHFGCALALHELEKDGEAMNHIARCHAIARSTGLTNAAFMGFLAEAKCAFDKGDDASGLISLKKAMTLGREKGCVDTTFAWIPGMMAELCQRALEAGIEVEYVRRLIQKRNLMPDPRPIDCEQWPWALKIYALGRFEIVKGDEAVQFSRKVQKKPLEMLKVLISNVDSEVSENLVADCLWPDANGDAAHSAFTTTLSRLRRLLGVEGAVRFQEGKVSLDPRYCWVDSLAFQRILAKLDKSEIPDALLLEKAVALYRGHFLPADEGLFWTISYRERLRSRFSSLITRAGGLLENSGQWERAIELYQKGLDIDDISEEFYQRLMICHQRLGRHTSVLEVYKRCKKLLSLNMRIEPSEKTKAIFRSITGSRD